MWEKEEEIEFMQTKVPKRNHESCIFSCNALYFSSITCI